MAADYGVVLPAVPGATSFMQLDSSGNMSASIAVSGGITASNIAALTITAAKIANATITTTQISASADIVGTQLSASANILGSQLDASAGIVGTQLSSSLALPVATTIGGARLAVTSSGSGVLAIADAVVASGGTVSSGRGISVSGHSTGNYTLSFSPVFSAVPTVTATSHSSTAIANIVSFSTSACLITTRVVGSPGTNVDAQFSVVAIGPQ